MRGFLKFISIFMLLVLVVGAGQVGVALIHFYMVYFGQVAPGEPVYVDERAFSLTDSAFLCVLGVALITLSVSVRALVRRRLSAQPHNTSLNPDPPKRAG